MVSVAAHNDRRGAYRVQPDKDASVAMAISTPGGDIWADEIVDLSLEGAHTRFPVGPTPVLAPGARVEVLVNSPQFRDGMTLQARVVACTLKNGGRDYRFRFEQPESLERHGSEELFALFNRRGAWRGVEPSEEDPLFASIYLAPDRLDDDEAHVVRVQNISTQGMCIIADPDLDDTLQLIESVRVDMELPGVESSLDLIARVRYRCKRGGVVLYGLYFDPVRSENRLDQAEDIFEYMLDRFEQQLVETGNPNITRH